MSIAGTVKTWNVAKGYGFLVADRGGAEAFVHFSQIDGSGLVPGKRVWYDLEGEDKWKRGAKDERTEKRPQRVAIRVCGEGLLPWPQRPGRFAGVVKLWVAGRSMGLITAKHNGEDVHVHSSAFGGGSLAIGKDVRYDVRPETHVKNGKKIAANVSGSGVINIGEHQGVVTAWMAHKGYGFAETPDGSEIYVHRSALSNGHCQPGKTIYFDLQPQAHESGRKLAINVTGPAVRPGSAADLTAYPTPKPRSTQKGGKKGSKGAHPSQAKKGAKGAHPEAAKGGKGSKGTKGGAGGRGAAAKGQKGGKKGGKGRGEVRDRGTGGGRGRGPRPVLGP